MRTLLAGLLVVVVALCCGAVRMVELGAFLDAAPALAYGIEADRWMPGLGAYARFVSGTVGALRASIATPFERMILRIGLRYTGNTRSRTAFGARMSAASALDGPVGAQVDSFFYLTPFRNETWTLRIGGSPFGVQANNTGGHFAARAFIPFNMTVDASLAISDRHVLRPSFEGALLLAPGSAQPLLPMDESLQGLTHVALRFGLRLP